ncbi:MAG: tetratricopeptide repeat protein, partial [Planctomycetaceae bacterium]|nr:tetratricopeptide repeat protein [Planctomycetaceae bacterium]
SSTHATIRVQGNFAPTDPPVIAPASMVPKSGSRTAGTIYEAVSQYKGSRRHFGGELVAPVLDLVKTAKELKQLNQLEQVIREAEVLLPDRTRDLLSLKLLVALAREDDKAAAIQLNALGESLKLLDPASPVYDRFAEIVALDAALNRPVLRKEIAAMTQLAANRNLRPFEWDCRLRALNAKALWLNANDTANLPQGLAPPKLSQWAVVSHPSAEFRSRGYAPPSWSSSRGKAAFFTGNGDDALYFQSPLTGDFEVRMKRTTAYSTELRPMYAGIGVELNHDGKSVWRCLLARGQVKQFPMVMENWSPFVDYRFVVQAGQYTAFVNEKQVYTEKISEGADPWLMIQTAKTLYTGRVEDVQILGLPKVPEVINLSQAGDLLSWRSTYYAESIDIPDARWKKEKDEIVGALLENSPGSQQQSVLQYHRPMLEDGEIQYDFFYEAGQTEIHPALDRAAFLLTPTGIQLHYLTDGAFDRTGLAPDNSTPLPDSAKILPLKEKQWNSLQLAVAGDVVTLTLNGEKVGSYKLEVINQRTFGLFRYSSATNSRVKNVTYRGNWPKEIPALLQQELATPK